MAATKQDPVKVAPHIYKVLLENDSVRVLHVRMQPGAKSPTHSHPAVVVYSLTGGKLRVATYPDGKTTVIDSKTGSVLWLEPQTHSVENIGSTETQDVVIELK